MKALGAPGMVASLASVLGLLVHPALKADAWLPSGATTVAALSLMLVLALASRARAGAADVLAAAGALAVVLALGYDAVRGHRGSLTLTVGQGTRTFDEDGPGGRSLGLRPLGFEVSLDRAGARGEIILGVTLDEGTVTPVEIGDGRAVRLGGFRLGDPRPITTGEAAILRIAVSGSGARQDVEVGPGRPARAGDLDVSLERYFPDFALDEKGLPFSRSSEPRNPAALLQVRRDASAWRVFVIRAVPGIHTQPGLDRSFALTAVEPAVALRIGVAREPAAGLAGAGILLVTLALAGSLKRT